MIFKVALVVAVLAVVANSLPAEKVKRNIPTPPMPPGMPSPPMSPPGMIFAFNEMHRNKRQAETTPPSRVARQAETTAPSRVARQAPETTQPSRVARSVFDAQEVPKTIAQEAFYSKITTINGDK